MKKQYFYFLAVILLLGVKHLKAQPGFVWAKQEGGIKTDQPRLLTADSSGNSYVLIYFQGIVAIGTQTLNDLDGENALVKYDKTGVIQWVIQLNNLIVSKIAAGPQHVYVCGRFADTASIGNTTMISTGGVDGFVIRLNGLGNVDLLLKGTGSGFEFINSIDVDKFGNMYTTGVYDTLSIFGTDTLRGTNSSNYFLIKYNSNGNIVWKSLGTQQNFYAIGDFISVSEDGTSVYALGMAGGANGFPNIDSVDFSNSNIYFQVYSNYLYFITKYDANGNLLAIKSFYGGNHYDMVDIDQDGYGNLYLADWGHYSDFGLRKFDTAFNLSWYRIIPSGAQSRFNDINVDAIGNIYMCGSFDNQICFPADTLKLNKPYGSYITATSFVAKYDSSGIHKWSMKAGTNKWNEAIGISIGEKDNVYISGYFADSLSLGPNNLAAVGPVDVYIAKINESNISTGIYENNFDLLIDIYPNPTPDKFVVQFPEGNSGFQQQCHLKIYNSSGQQIKSQQLISLNNEIDLSQQAKGIYFVEVLCNDKRKTSKIILK